MLVSSHLTRGMWKLFYQLISRVSQKVSNIRVRTSLMLRLDYTFGSRSDALRSFLGEGIFTQDGPRWKHSREMLRRPFVKMHYQNLNSFGEHIDDLITSLQRCSGAVDLQPFFFRFTLQRPQASYSGSQSRTMRQKHSMSLLVVLTSHL